ILSLSKGEVRCATPLWFDRLTMRASAVPGERTCTMTTINLPNPDRSISPYRLTGDPIPFVKFKASDFPRIAYSAAHVVADPLASNDPWLTPAVDWETTLKFRHRMWDLGLGVAEAMDTAQRGMGLGWTEAQELIRRSQAEARTRDDALIAYGAGTDHLAP